MIGNLTRPDGVLAPKTKVERVGIGTRVRMLFTDVAPELALPQRTIGESASGHAVATELRRVNPVRETKVLPLFSRPSSGVEADHGRTKDD